MIDINLIRTNPDLVRENIKKKFQDEKLTLVDQVIEQAGIRRRLRLTVPHFMAVGPVLQATDMIAVVPRRFADCACKPFGLATAPCPVKIPESVINVFWHARNHREPANQWLRQVVVEQFAD